MTEELYDELIKLRVYKGKDPFSFLVLGLLLTSLGILALLYLEEYIK